MQRFSISRVHTTKGIFRASGEWANTGHDKNENMLIILTLDVMSTDGWVELDIQQHKTQALIAGLRVELIQHLQEKTTASLNDMT